ncbi:MAG: hypothetical protein EA408_08255 [Marinilabiliales bacterium]|nr:MAG: hypothetical protein EA408_08255 [Marinilabiliales bacterium]
MLKLIKIELVKLLNYTSFKVILLLHLALFSLVVFVSSRIDITVPGFDTGNLFRFPHVWSYFSWIASWFNLLLAILIIMVAGNEFSYRTFRQHVIDGLSRSGLLGGKMLVVLMIAFYALILVLVTGLIYGTVYTSGITADTVFAGMHILLVYFLQTISFMVIGLLLVLLLRSTALSIIIFVLLRFPIEPVIRAFLPQYMRPFFPMKAVGSLTPMPEFLSISSETAFETADGTNALTLSEMGLVAQGLPLLGQVLLALGYTILFTALAWLIIKRRNL